MSCHFAGSWLYLFKEVVCKQNICLNIWTDLTVFVASPWQLGNENSFIICFQQARRVQSCLVLQSSLLVMVYYVLCEGAACGSDVNSADKLWRTVISFA